MHDSAKLQQKFMVLITHFRDAKIIFYKPLLTTMTGKQYNTRVLRKVFRHGEKLIILTQMKLLAFASIIINSCLRLSLSCSKSWYLYQCSNMKCALLNNN